jgi:hypothetical protein
MPVESARDRESDIELRPVLAPKPEQKWKESSTVSDTVRMAGSATGGASSGSLTTSAQTAALPNSGGVSFGVTTVLGIGLVFASRRNCRIRRTRPY